MNIELDLLPELLEYCEDLTKTLKQAREKYSSDEWEEFETEFPFLAHVVDSTLDVEDTFLKMTGKLEIKEPD
jgi:hypothetical protein